MDTSHLVVGRLGPNLRPRQQIQNRRPGAPSSQARRGARDASRTGGPDRAEQSDEFIGLLAHEVARTRRASRLLPDLGGDNHGEGVEEVWARRTLSNDTDESMTWAAIHD